MNAQSNALGLPGLQALRTVSRWVTLRPGLLPDSFRLWTREAFGGLSPAVKTQDPSGSSSIASGSGRHLLPWHLQLLRWGRLPSLERPYRQPHVSTDMLGYTFRTTFRFSSRKRTPSEFILSGTQQGSGMPGMMPTALTMLWMVAWLDGRTICKMRR